MPARADALATFLTAPADPEAAEGLSALHGSPLFEIELDQALKLRECSDKLRPGAPLLIGTDRDGRTPADLVDLCDVLLTTATSPPRPWVDVTAWGVDEAVAAMDDVVGRNPVAASIYCQVLRLGERLTFAEALTVESLAYSALLAGREFRSWRSANPPRQRRDDGASLVRLERLGDRLIISLARPAARNALCARLRDDLAAALQLASLDDTMIAVELRGDGPSFSAGGDLDEFGLADDLARAHLIRVHRSATDLVHQLGSRMTVFVHGSAVGGGIEIAAAAANVRASPGAVFRLPEVSMGLIPGAGGTASLPRRIGRHRAAFMGLSGLEVDAETALAWQLVDSVGTGG